jgi:hypothetical protein
VHAPGAQVKEPGFLDCQQRSTEAKKQENNMKSEDMNALQFPAEFRIFHDIQIDIACLWFGRRHLRLDPNSLISEHKSLLSSKVKLISKYFQGRCCRIKIVKPFLPCCDF